MAIIANTIAWDEVIAMRRSYTWHILLKRVKTAFMSKDITRGEPAAKVLSLFKFEIFYFVFFKFTV